MLITLWIYLLGFQVFDRKKPSPDEHTPPNALCGRKKTQQVACRMICFLPKADNPPWYQLHFCHQILAPLVNHSGVWMLSHTKVKLQMLMPGFAFLSGMWTVQKCILSGSTMRRSPGYRRLGRYQVPICNPCRNNAAKWTLMLLGKSLGPLLKRHRL